MRRRQISDTKIEKVKDMLINGYPWTRIESDVSVAPATINNIYKENKDEIDDARQKKADEVKIRIYGMSSVAADTLMELLLNPDINARVKLDASKYCIDAIKKAESSDALAIIRALVLNDVEDINPSE